MNGLSSRLTAIGHQIHEMEERVGWRGLLARLGFTLAIAILLLGLKMSVEERQFMASLRLAAAHSLHARLNGLNREPANVLMINLEGIKTDHGPGVASDQGATSRDQLRTLIARVGELSPAGIGIDVDFSPEDDHNPVTFGDPAFFTWCESESKKLNCPIVLGVYRQTQSPRPDWLGSGGFANLAGAMDIGNRRYQSAVGHYPITTDEVMRMPAWILIKPSGQKIPCFSSAMVPEKKMAYRYLERYPGFFSRLDNFEGDEEFQSAGYLVDYGHIDQLYKDTVPFKSVASLMKSEVQGRYVIMGNVGRFQTDADAPSGLDIFKIPSHFGWYSGSLVHASGVETISSSPLYKLTRIGALISDLLIVTLVFGIFEGIRVFRNDWESAHGVSHLFRWGGFGVATLLLFGLGALLVRSAGLFWDDLIVVVGSVGLHTLLEWGVAVWAHPSLQQDSHPVAATEPDNHELRPLENESPGHDVKSEDIPTTEET